MFVAGTTDNPSTRIGDARILVVDYGEFGGHGEEREKRGSHVPGQTEYEIDGVNPVSHK
jgi:hypothetical protein